MIGGDIVTYLNHDLFVNAILQWGIDWQWLDIGTAHNLCFRSCFCIRNNDHGIVNGKDFRFLWQLILHGTWINNIAVQCTCSCGFRRNQTNLRTQGTASAVEIPVKGTQGKCIGNR